MTITIDEELDLIKRNRAPVAAAPAIAVTPPPPAADAGLPPAEEGLEALPEAGADMFDVIGAAWTDETIRTDAWNDTQKRRRALAESMYELLPSAAKMRIWASHDDYTQGWNSFEDLVLGEVSADVPANPAKYGNLPLSREQFDQRITDERKAELASAQAVLDQPGGGFSEFVGASARAMTDQTSLMLLPFGVSGSVWRTIAGEAVLGAAGEAAVLPREYQVAQELDLAAPDPWSRILTGAALGGGLSAGIIGIAKGVGMLRSRSAALRDSQPDGADPLDHEARVEEAEGELRGDRTVREGMTPYQEQPDGSMGDILATPVYTTLPPVGPDAPADWASIRNGIFAGESGGDYNALFGYQNRKGGKFSRVRLTQMTVQQAIEFSDPRGAYGQWVKGKIGRVATPMGAYQIVGTTLRAAAKALRLQGDEVMTPELQEQLAHWIYKTQGTGAWEGYKGPRTSFTPYDPDAGSSDFGPTSRGYTGTGQISAGDEFRIDVEYEVVDAGSIFRASGDFQPRDRSRIASDAWISDTAARLDPAQLMPSPTADRGAPIVGPDGMIESGNGRFGAIERAYARVPDRAAAYRSQIEAAGFAIPEGVERPVLIARRKSDLSRDELQRFTVAAQDSGVAVMTPTEMARASSRAMTAPVLGRLDPSQPLASAANGDFVRGALAALPRSARNAMFDGDGILNKEGQRQLREALFARAWPDPDILARYTETDAGDLKTLLEALDRAAPSWAALKADIEAGLVRPEMDISGHVLDAMRLIGNARDLSKKQGLSIASALDELLDEVDMLEGAVAPLTVALVRKFWRNGRAAAADDVASFLTRYADDARKVGGTDTLFGGPSPRDVLVAIDKPGFGDLPEDLGTARGFAVPAADPAPVASVEGFNDGAASPEAEAADAEILASLTGSAEVTAPQLIEALAPGAARQLIDLRALDPQVAQELQGSLKAAQPYRDADALMNAAALNHAALNDAAAAAATVRGLTFAPAPLKNRARVIQKVTDKYAGDYRKIADVARTGVTADTIEAADAFVAALAQQFHIIDEGWIRTPEGYFDRKLMVRFDDGQLGEIQIWPPGMKDAKSAGGGHKLYAVSRDRSLPQAARDDAVQAMSALYSSVNDQLDPSFAAKLGAGAPRVDSATAASASDSSIARSSPSTSSAILREPSSGAQASEDQILARPASLTAASSPKSNVNSLIGEIPPLGRDAESVSALSGEVNSAPEAAQAIAALGGRFDDLTIDMPDGTTITVAEALDDLNTDTGFDAFVQACAITPAGGTAQ